MADATLNDVILKLRADNDKQLREQHSTTDAVKNLSSTIRALLEKMEGDALKNREALLEANKKNKQPKPDTNTSSRSSSNGKSLAVFGNPFKGLFSSIGSLVAFAGAFALATEGLGPSIKDLNKFTKGMNKLFLLPARLATDLVVAPGKSIYDKVFKNVKLIEDSVEKRFSPFLRRVTPGDIARGLKTKSGELVKLGQVTNLADARESSLTQKQKPQSALVRFFSDINRMIKNVMPTKTVKSAIEKLKPVFEAIKNNRMLLNIVRFVKPLAAILSVFDGIKTARKEMEDEQGIVDKLFAGTGGLVGGTLGSFFGEFANVLKNIPIFIIKKLLPKDYLITDKDGNVTINKDKNLLTKILGGIETLDFNQLIKDLIQIPFEKTGEAITSITTGLGWTGTEDEKIKSKAAWTTWWNNWKTLNGFGKNVSSMAGVAFEIVYSPVNTILEALLKNFTKDGQDREKTTMMEKINKFALFIQDLIPSPQYFIDRLPEGVAKALGLTHSRQHNNDLINSTSDIREIIKDINNIKDLRADMRLAKVRATGSGSYMLNSDLEQEFSTRLKERREKLKAEIFNSKLTQFNANNDGAKLDAPVINNNNNAIGDAVFLSAPESHHPESLRFPR